MPVSRYIIAPFVFHFDIITYVIYSDLYRRCFSKTPATISLIVAFVTITPLKGLVDDSFLINNSKSPLLGETHQGIVKRGETCLNIIYRL